MDSLSSLSILLFMRKKDQDISATKDAAECAMKNIIEA